VRAEYRCADSVDDVVAANGSRSCNGYTTDLSTQAVTASIGHEF
jgi:hypothetical protein